MRTTNPQFIPLTNRSIRPQLTNPHPSTNKPTGLKIIIPPGISISTKNTRMIEKHQTINWINKQYIITSYSNYISRSVWGNAYVLRVFSTKFFYLQQNTLLFWLYLYNALAKVFSFLLSYKEEYFTQRITISWRIYSRLWAATTFSLCGNISWWNPIFKLMQVNAS